MGRFTNCTGRLLAVALGGPLHVCRREGTHLGMRRRRRPGVKLRILVGGDFNTNEDDPAFVSEATLRSFYGAHYRSCFRDWKKSQCVTHPGDRNFPDATFDYILYHGFERIVSRRIFPGAPVSDHNLVALRLR